MWQVIGSTAELSLGQLTGSVDLTRPWLGLTLSVADLAEPNQILGVWFENRGATANTPPLEAHVRGTDLIARYAEDQQRFVRIEVYWRAIEKSGDGAIGFELVTSVQTSKLTSKPRLETSSRIAAQEVHQIAAHPDGEGRVLNFETERLRRLDQPNSFPLLRRNNASLSYCEMVHPSDFVSTTIEQTGSEDTVAISHELFPQSLEKGVIRRGRVRGIFLPHERDVELARTHFHEFTDSKPVLST